MITALGCAWLSACQLLLDVDEPQCETDADCVGLLGRGYTCGAVGVCRNERPETSSQDAAVQLPQRWACLDEPPSRLDIDPERTVVATFDVLDFTSLEPPDDLTAKACGPRDFGCSDPVDSDEPDSDGFVALDVSEGFDGYFELEAPGFMPALSYINVILVEDLEFPGPNLVTAGTLDEIARFGDESIDPSRGTVILEAADCQGDAAEGVRLVKVDDTGERPFYFEGALPDRMLEATMRSTAFGRDRLPRAVGGFNNIRPGYVTFELYHVELERTIATVAVQVRAGYVTYVLAYPDTGEG